MKPLSPFRHAPCFDDTPSLQQDAELCLLPPLQVAALTELSVEAEARLQSQARGHDEAVEQMQQQRKVEEEAHAEKLSTR